MLSDLWKKAIALWLYAASAIAEAVLATLLAAKVISTTPVWWGTAIVVVVLVVTTILGKPWKWSTGPEA